MRVVLLSEYVAEDGAPYTGSHLQSHLIAKLVAERWESVLIAFSHRGEREEYSEGKLKVVLLPPSRWEAVRALRMFWAALRERPDVLYVRGRSYQLAVGTIIKLLRGSALVWNMTSQEGYKDFKHTTALIRSRRPFLRKLLLVPVHFLLDLGIALGMRVADVIVAQNGEQLVKAKSKFKRKRILVLPNVQVVEDVASTPEIGRISHPYFVWASSNPSPIKRPELLVNIAENLPDVRFVMVGYGTESQPDLHNLTALPRLPRGKFHALLREARGLVITSRSEGTPNVVIEAMLLGVPVVSVGDDFGILSEGGGIVVKDVDEAVKVIGRLAHDDTLHSRLSEEARALAHRRFVEGARKDWLNFWSSVLEWGVAGSQSLR